MAPFEQLAIIWFGVLIAAFLANRTRLTPVLFFLAVGAVFVNTGLLPEEPAAFVRGFAEIGIVLIMFAIGFEERVDHFMESIKRSWGIALFGAIAPFLATYAVTWYFWQSVPVSLVASLAMTATAVSLTMVALKGEGLGSSEAATRIMTSAVLDDIAALALVAVIVPIAAGGGIPGLSDLLLILVKVVGFFVIVTFLGVWIFPLTNRPAAGAWRLRSLLAFEGGHYATLILMLFALVIGLLAHALGFHPAVGAYMAGLILREEYFSEESKDTQMAYSGIKSVLDNVAFVWIGPVFFVLLGAQMKFDLALFIDLIPETLTLTVALIVAQVTSATLAARYTGNMNFAASLMIGFGMLGRAELAFVVMDIAYVQNHILTDHAFYTLMFTAFWLNIAVPLTIRWWKPYYLRTNPQTEVASSS
jgi:Kef-type K+ transport system membrane component KefB